MKTEILEVVEWKDKGLIIKFNYFGNLKFTKLTYKSLEYWQNIRKINKFEVGLKINVFKVPQTVFYKIIEVY